MNINKDSLTSDIKVPKQTELAGNDALRKTRGQSKAVKGRGRALPIESLKTQDKETQITAQRRSVVEYNISNVATPSQRAIPSRTRQPNPPNPDQAESPQTQTVEQHIGQPQAVQERQSEMVQVRIGPFETIVTSGNTEESIFGGQVFLLRNVQIEDRNSLQGFQLNENKLIEEVKESAAQAISTREGMGFELVKTQSVDWVPNDVNEDAAYTAILDFGLGYLALNLIETDPDRIGRQISWLRNWYFGIIAIVLLAVSLGLTGLWRSARAQIRLAQKKDDFISAVSHELRTPLTSIRMYSEMLEKNWVKSEDKLTDYYRNMRQESERLSRLIENVLDFSRIQRGRKKYTFKIGNINKCIADVVKIMRPYAAQRGFSIKMELGQVEQTTFDNDAVTQIAVNLLDNAVKYAHDAEDKTITVRTRSDKQFTLIEVEDHGPGVPHRQRKKIFEQFYRSGAEGTRETTGTGLGLALVKKFAQAHNGFVDIFSAKPTGAIFRVALAAQV
jgi:signal transduction histidine kinase